MNIREDVSALYFDFTRAYLYEPIIIHNQIMIPIEKFGVLAGYLEIKNFVFYSTCHLVYEDVISAKRIVHPYHIPTGFLDTYELIDINRSVSLQDVFLFGLEGVSKERNAWIDWEIVAKSVRIEEV
jgi:hypothetical protein